jgi:hypothetical protein
MILSETAAAASFGLTVSVSQLGGIVGPYVIGFLNDTTQGGVTAPPVIIACGADCLVLVDPATTSE